MYFQEFQRKVNKNITGHEIADQLYEHNHLIQKSVDGVILVDRKETLFSSLEEACNHIRQKIIQEDIHREISKEMYTEMSQSNVVDIIKKYHSDIKVTNSLIESFLDIASSNIFTLDPVIRDIHKAVPSKSLLEGYSDFILDDGSHLAVSEQKLQHINNIFGKYPDVVEYMRESSDNFLNILDQLEE